MYADLAMIFKFSFAKGMLSLPFAKLKGPCASMKYVSDPPRYTVYEHLFRPIRLRDASGNLVTSSKSAGAYVPPSKRLAMATGGDEKRQIQLEILKRQLKGQFNRYV